MNIGRSKCSLLLSTVILLCCDSSKEPSSSPKRTEESDLGGPPVVVGNPEVDQFAELQVDHAYHGLDARTSAASKGGSTRGSKVRVGTKERAANYYARISGKEHLNFPDARPPASLDAVLVWLGHGDLRAIELEQARPVDLIKKRPSHILSSRFFAPKITDVSKPLGANNGVGWRKIVRVLPNAGSRAATQGIESAWILFNIFSPPGERPYKPNNHSVNTQLILVSGQESERDPIYFLVFGPLADDGTEGVLVDALNATFDARDPKLDDRGGIQPYFVPDACGQCHGRRKSSWKLNYLDTDHWFDRVEEGDDFSAVAKADVIFDSNDGMSEHQAFANIVTLNREIEAQNKRTDGGFQLDAVQKWVELHRTRQGHIPLAQRSFGATSWSSAEEPDKALLPLLNRYCYRCHSSVRFHIYNRAEVVKRKKDHLDKLDAKKSLRFIMPQDRNLPPAVRQRLIELVKEL